MKIGKLQSTENDIYVGELCTLQLQLDQFFLKPNVDRISPNAPGYIACVPIGNREAEIGAAWKYEIKRGEKAGQHMFSIALDDPSFERAFNISAFPSNDGSWEIAWSRPKAPSIAQVNDVATSADEIPLH